MELGQRIKEARLAAGLSQKALCADVITRNMLSQIESGKAKPSMDTLRYLANRLEKPVGYFLEEDATPNGTCVTRARQAYAQGQYADALDLLGGFRRDDPLLDGEKDLLETLCLMELARKAIAEGRLPFARKLLQQAGAQTLAYHLPGLERERLLLLYQTGEPACLPTDDRELLARAEAALEAGDPRRSAVLLEAAEGRDDRWALLRGKAAVAMGDHPRAVAYLQQAENTYPRQAIPLLEIAFREQGDFKNAYLYACKQRP